MVPGAALKRCLWEIIAWQAVRRQKYSYKFYFLDTAGIGLYGGVSKAVYIQTDNPDPNSIQLLSNGKTVLINLSNLGGGQYYDDIEYLNADDYDNSLHKVKGRLCRRSGI